MRILQINEDTIKDIERVKVYAIAHPYDENYRSLQLSGDVSPVGDNPEHVIHIHDGYRVVYSISVINSIKFHHISISVESKTQYPSIPSVSHIIELFGMGNDVNNVDNVWLEESACAVNLIKELVE